MCVCVCWGGGVGGGGGGGQWIFYKGLLKLWGEGGVSRDTVM